MPETPLLAPNPSLPQNADLPETGKPSISAPKAHASVARDSKVIPKAITAPPAAHMATFATGVQGSSRRSPLPYSLFTLNPR